MSRRRVIFPISTAPPATGWKRCPDCGWGRPVLATDGPEWHGRRPNGRRCWRKGSARRAA